MRLSEVNEEIIAEFARVIATNRFEGRLALDPIPNTLKRRQHYYKGKDGVCYFTAYLWDLNKLDKSGRTAEINRRVNEAARYFGLK